MIPKSGNRFSGKIMLNKEIDQDTDSVIQPNVILI